VHIFQCRVHVNSTLKFPYPSGLLIHQRRIYVDSTSRSPHGSERGPFDIIGDIIGYLEVPDESLFALLTALKLWCNVKNKGEWFLPGQLDSRTNRNANLLQIWFCRDLWCTEETWCKINLRYVLIHTAAGHHPAAGSHQAIGCLEAAGPNQSTANFENGFSSLDLRLIYVEFASIRR